MSTIALTDVLLTLLLPIALTFGNLTYGFLMPFPLLFIFELVYGAGARNVRLGTFVLLLRLFLLSFYN
jgi:hypothetical protein